MDKILYFLKKILPAKLFRRLQPAYHFCLAALSARFCGQPGEKLIVIGVTGTTGKTTAVYLLAKALNAAGYRVGFTSTAVLNDGVKEWLNDKKMTMIGRFYTQAMLRRMVKNGCRFAIIETTSEGIAQYRHRFINYDLVVVTGLYPEHIEAHGSFEQYRSAKGRLIAHLSAGRTKYRDECFRVQLGAGNLKKLDLQRVKKTLIVNLDDAQAQYFLNFPVEQKFAISRDRGPEKNPLSEDKITVYHYGSVRASRRGLSFDHDGHPVSLRLLGDFNAANAMLALSLCRSLGLPLAKAINGLARIEGIPGRLEMIAAGQDFTVIVDYAFEPNAVRKLYETVKAFAPARIIHVLGAAGGGRDQARRPQVGRLAGENADLVIVTNEDPYDDDPLIIMKQVFTGAEQAGKKKDRDLFLFPDRRQAIKKALFEARAGDLVLVTGKGSEQAICGAGGEKIPWDDRAVVRGLLTELLDKKSSATPAGAGGRPNE